MGCGIGPHSRRPWLSGIGHIERCFRLCPWSTRWRADARRGAGARALDCRCDGFAALRAVCRAVSKPVNFMVGIKGRSFPVSDLAAAGVRRISLATSLYRAAMTGFLDAAYQVRDTGQFGFLDRCVTTPELAKLMGT